MNQLEQKPKPQRHYSIENYRASTPPGEWVEPTQIEVKQVEIKQRHDAVMARLHMEARRWRRTYRIMIVAYLCVAESLNLGDVYREWLLRHYPVVTHAI